MDKNPSLDRRVGLLKNCVFLKDMKVSSCLSLYLTTQDCNINFHTVIAISIFKKQFQMEPKLKAKKLQNNTTMA